MKKMLLQEIIVKTIEMANQIIKSELGNIPIDIPRDKNNEFEQRIIPRVKTHFDGFESYPIICTKKKSKI